VHHDAGRAGDILGAADGRWTYDIDYTECLLLQATGDIEFDYQHWGALVTLHPFFNPENVQAAFIETTTGETTSLLACGGEYLLFDSHLRDPQTALRASEEDGGCAVLVRFTDAGRVARYLRDLIGAPRQGREANIQITPVVHL